MTDLVCYLCGSTEDVELDDALGILPVEKPTCTECWFHSEPLDVANRVLRVAAERGIRDVLGSDADAHDWSLSDE